MAHDGREPPVVERFGEPEGEEVVVLEQYQQLDNVSDAEEEGGDNNGGEGDDDDDEHGEAGGGVDVVSAGETAEWISFAPTTDAAALQAEEGFAAFEDEFGTFEGDSSAFSDPAEFGAFASSPCGSASRLADTDVALIKKTMAALDIAPPPWIRQMVALKTAQLAQAQLAASRGEAPPELTNLSGHWQAHVAARAEQVLPEASVVLSSATLAAASPFLPGTAHAGAEGHGVSVLGGLPLARKRVTAKQLAVERRREREEQQREAAANRVCA